MLIHIHPENPQERLIQQAVEVLQKGGVIIYPTDTVYGIGCDVNSRSAVERICQIKNINPKKAQFSVICENLSHLSEYTHQINTQTYRSLKKALPGPYTFILKANNKLPKAFLNNKKTIGIRVPDNTIAQRLTAALGHPIVSTSLNKYEDDIQEYHQDPSLIHDRYEKLVDLVIDGGWGGLDASTIVDCTQEEWEVLREGKGDISLL